MNHKWVRHRSQPSLITRAIAVPQRFVKQRLKQLRYSSSKAQEHPFAAEYQTWRDRFLYQRLRLVLWVGLIFVLTVVLFFLAIDLAQAEVFKLSYYLSSAAVVLSLLSCLLFHRTAIARRHPEWLLLGFCWSLIVVTQVSASVAGSAILLRPLWLFVFVTQAILLPVRWPVHIVAQLGAVLAYFGVNAALGLLTRPWLDYVAMFLTLGWICIVCNLAVYLYEQLQRKEFYARRELEVALSDRQQAEAALRVFFHAVSHDLRNPIIGTLLLLKNIEKQPGDPVTLPRKVLERLIQGGDRQIELIHQLLEAHVNEAKGMVVHSEPLSLEAVVEQVVVELEPLLAKNQATLINTVSGHLPPVMADPTQLWRVYENLISNALHHNPPHLTLKVEATVTPDGMHCTIADNGVGMSAEQCDRLFNPYIRGDKRSVGFGLGLYICQQIVQAHGGEIGVVSSPGKGATFWFTLPLAEVGTLPADEADC